MRCWCTCIDYNGPYFNITIIYVYMHIQVIIVIGYVLYVPNKT